VRPRRLKVYRILEGLLVQAVRQVYIGARHIIRVHVIPNTGAWSTLVQTSFLEDALSLPARRPALLAPLPWTLSRPLQEFSGNWILRTRARRTWHSG
jgi:hypothetical protein